MIVINNIKETECKLYDDNNTLVGIIKSSLSLNDVRIQIGKQKLSGYYIMWEGNGCVKIPILPNGDLTRWPTGFYDGEQKQFAILAKIRRGEL